MSIQKLLVTLAIAATLVMAAVLVVVHPPSGQVMLILRGIADPANPRGQLDDASALEYARRTGFRGEVLDAAGDSHQVQMALERLHRDETITAIYGFSGGGYNARLIWRQLTPVERARVRRVVVVGSPGITKSDFPGSPDVVIQPDPDAGHMAGPRALLDSLGSKSFARQQVH